ncbi:MAG: hypothetical protein ACI89L_000457 [Phycisphaerales bacterium]|jgi:hypothetical protein
MSDNDHTEFGGLDQGEYDALAELFLGDSTFAPPRRARSRDDDGAPDRAPEGSPEEAPPSGGETSQIARDERPNAETRPASRFPSHISPGIGDVPRTRPPSLGPARVELVILGHLPVRAGLWLKEYAASVATEDAGPVALLRLAPDIASVDLIGSGGFEPHGAAPTFGDAVRRARIDASRFVLRVNETAEPALAENEAVDRVTILTGTDEAALVASYRLVKSLAAAWDRQFELDEGPTLRLAIMGSGDASARAAATKLQSAAESFLQRRVEIQICSSRIGATPSLPSTSIFRGEANESVGDLLGLIRPSRAARETGPSEPRPNQAGPSETGRRETDTGLRLVGGEPGTQETGYGEPSSEEPISDELAPEPSPEIVIRRSGVREPSLDAPAMTADEPISSRVGPTQRTHTAGKTAGRPTGQTAAPRMRRATTSTLASRLTGLTTLETVCPFSSGVEFAAGADGSLHLLTECEIQTESRGGTDSADRLDADHLGAGVERLVAASAWARAHLSLLLRAEPRLAMPSAERSDDDAPVLHLLTGGARAARGLLDSDVFVHLTRAVEVGGERVWVTDDLN